VLLLLLENMDVLSLLLDTITPTSFILPMLFSDPFACPFPVARTGAFDMSKTMLLLFELLRLPMVDCLDAKVEVSGGAGAGAGAGTGDATSVDANMTFGAESLRSSEFRCLVMSATGTGIVSAVCGSGVPDLLLGVDVAGDRCCSRRRTDDDRSSDILTDFRRIDCSSPEYCRGTCGCWGAGSIVGIAEPELPAGVRDLDRGGGVGRPLYSAVGVEGIPLLDFVLS
jgi:hypothetical protein